MPTQNKRNPNPENPKELKGIRVSKIKETAAGPKGILSSAQHVLKEMGPGRAMKALNSLNQKGGYDCPGCAWPDPDDERSKLGEYCENGVKAIADEATTKALRPDFFAKHSVNEMAAWDDYELGKKGRIAQPMYLPKDATHYQPITWDESFNLVAKHLNGLKSPNEAIFYTSGRTSNEAAFLYQLFVRAYGTNNLPDCSNMCHESSGVALGETLGIGKGSVKLEDFYEAEVILILGQNPGTNHPRMLNALKKAHDKGTYIVSINPLPETGLTKFADPQSISGFLGMGTSICGEHLAVKINGDMALLQIIEKRLIEEDQLGGNVLDPQFIRKHTSGFENYRDHILKRDVDALSLQCGIHLDQIEKVVNKIKHKDKIIACWAMGLTQHKNSVDTIKEIVNLLLIKGSIGKPGAGTCPVRGHSNVQGDRTVGIYEKPWDWLLDNLEKNYGFQPPREYGWDVVQSIEAMHNGSAKVFFGLGGNFLSATPDTKYTAEALQNCDLTVQVSTKMNRSHLITGREALILPTLGRSDKDIQENEIQFVSCENSMGVIQSSQGVLDPVSDELLGEPGIVCRLAKAVLGERSPVNWDKYLRHYDNIRSDIERTIPGFDDYNQRVRNPGGFYLPNSARSGVFTTDSKKANFTVSTAHEVSLKEDELLMMTIRSHDQYNTTIYGLNDRYRGIQNERRVVLMNEIDMEQRHLKPLDVVDLYNDQDGRHRIAHKFLVISYPIPEKCVATYFPEANVLVPIKSVAEKSNTPASKSVVIKVKNHSV